MGAYLVLFPRRRVHVLLPWIYGGITQISGGVMLGIWFVLQFVNGIASLSAGTAQTGGVAVWAHIGGFVAGAIVGFFIRGRIGVRQKVYA